VAGVCALLAAAVWFVFGQTVHHDFVNYDDDVYVYQNPHVKTGLTRDNIVWAFTHRHDAMWHPVTSLSHMLDCQMYGVQPGGQHLTNVLLHTATVILLFLVLRGMTGAQWPSAFVAGVFAVHPLHVESVAWVSERKDVLSTLFWLLTMWAYVKSARLPAPGSKNYYWLALLFFACGWMSKPMVATLPVVLLVMDWWPLKRIYDLRLTIDESKEGERQGQDAEPKAGTVGLMQALKEKIPFLALSAAGSLVAIHAQDTVKAYGKQSLLLHLGNALVSFVTYIGEFFWPTKLAMFYPYPDHIALWRVAGAALIFVAITLGVIRLGSRHPYLPAGWLWFLITLMPVMGVVQVGMQSMADRYTYVPYIGLGIMVSWGLGDLASLGPRLRELTIFAAAAGLACCMAVTRAQVEHWRNSTVLNEHALAVTSGNYIAHNNLGRVLADHGQTEAAMTHFKLALAIRPGYVDAWYNLAVALQREGRLGEAISNYEGVLAIRPRYPTVQWNLGNCCLQLGRTNEAIAHYQTALKINPADVMAHDGLGKILFNVGRVNEAAEQFHEALQSDPGRAESYSDLGKVFMAQGLGYKAAEMYQNAVRLDPKLAEAHWDLGSLWLQEGETAKGLAELQRSVELTPGKMDLRQRFGDALMKAGRATEAQSYYETVVRAEPGNARARFALGQAYLAQKNYEQAIAGFKEAARLAPDSAEFLNGLARVYATSPKAEIRNGAVAVRLAERACELTKHQNLDMLDTLGAADAEAGRFADAVKAAEETRALAEATYHLQAAETERQRAALYKSGKAYHDE
jgi:tetratricopeptide (TPR) repeat protein